MAMNEIEEHGTRHGNGNGGFKPGSAWAPSNAWTGESEQDNSQETLLRNNDGSADAPENYKVPVLLDWYMKITILCLRLVCSKVFQSFITFVIILASVLVGIQTYPAMENDNVLNITDKIILYIFSAECLLKILAAGLKPWEYVYDSDGLNFWNVFDFLVVVVCYLPLDASMVTVIRLFRLLRVLKLVRTLPELQILVMGLLGSVYSIFYVALLLCLVYYLYGIMLLSFFKENDPVNFHDLQTVFLTLFRMSTMDDWTDIMYSQMYGNDIVPCDNYRADQCTTPTRQPWLASMMCVTFTVLSSFVVLNLFIGVVAQQMEEAKDRLTKENERRQNMAGCKDEFDEDERTAQLISLRFEDLIAECNIVQAEADAIREAIQKIQAMQRRQLSRSRNASMESLADSYCSSREGSYSLGQKPGILGTLGSFGRRISWIAAQQDKPAENDPTAGPPGAIGESLEEIVTPYDEMMSMIHEQLGYCDDQIKQIGTFNRQ